LFWLLETTVIQNNWPIARALGDSKRRGLHVEQDRTSSQKSVLDKMICLCIMSGEEIRLEISTALTFS